MIKLGIHTLATDLDPEKLMQILSPISSSQIPEMFLIWVNSKNYETLRITESPLYYGSNSDLHTLVKLLLAHPAFSVRPGLITPLYAQMLQLMGIDNEVVENVREELAQKDFLLIAIQDIKAELNKFDSVKCRKTFNIKLHRNFHNMIKKASLNMFQLPSIENFTERLVHDYTF